MYNQKKEKEFDKRRRAATSSRRGGGGDLKTKGGSPKHKRKQYHADQFDAVLVGEVSERTD